MAAEYHDTKLALGSDVTLVLVSDRGEAAVAEVFRSLWYTIYCFERQFSRFIPSSELSVFNRSAGSRLPISPEFRDILRVARQLGLETGGLFNPLILPALHRAGYKQSFVEHYQDDVQDDYSARTVVQVERLEVTDTTACIPYGTALDLGGCGKGYLADLLANTIVPDWLDGYWLSLGGDVVGEGCDGSGKPWKVAIQSAFKDNTASRWCLQTTGKRFAAATSGTGVRTGTQQGKRWHHIIDPRTLQPSNSDVRMATVFDESAVRADVLASCAVILGTRQALPFLKTQGAQAAYLQGRDKTMKRTESQFGAALQRAGTPRKELAHA